MFPHVRPHIVWPRGRLFSLSVSHRTMYVHPVVFLSYNESLWNLSTYLTILEFHQRSNNHRYFLQHYIQRWICSPGYVDELHWNGKWFFSRHVQFDSGFHVMTVNKIAWNGPEIISSFTNIQRWVLKWGWRKTRLILLEDYLVLLVGLGCPRLRWMFSRSSSSPEIMTVPSAIGNMKVSPFIGVDTFLYVEPSGIEFRCVHLLQFFNVCDHYVSFPDSFRGQRISKEYTWQDFRTTLM